MKWYILLSIVIGYAYLVDFAEKTPVFHRCNSVVRVSLICFYWVLFAVVWPVVVFVGLCYAFGRTISSYWK